MVQFRSPPKTHPLCEFDIGCAFCRFSWVRPHSHGLALPCVANPFSLLSGLFCMYEVLSTMSVLMAPITPFFSEYTYRHLRECHPDKDNENVAEDAKGRASSVHMLMMPEVDESR